MQEEDNFFVKSSSFFVCPSASFPVLFVYEARAGIMQGNIPRLAAKTVFGEFYGFLMGRKIFASMGLRCCFVMQKWFCRAAWKAGNGKRAFDPLTSGWDARAHRLQDGLSLDLELFSVIFWR